MAVIVPTPGRQVWYRPSRPDIDSMDCLDPAAPMAATVVYVHDERTVNLQVLDQNGRTHPRQGVQLVQEGDPEPIDGGFCQWMPYQRSVAKGETPPAVHAQPDSEPRNGVGPASAV